MRRNDGRHKQRAGRLPLRRNWEEECVLEEITFAMINEGSRGGEGGAELLVHERTIHR